ncbi:hypothetical protein ACQ86N_15855 [Puia sp. P3]|uniref:hypothetical protein n=1 Tax=Puia sp. P3 TaxID=3423952 RepID=UPI003D665C8D
MNIALSKFVDRLKENQQFKCRICGASKYVTDQGNHELTFHCSSTEARFWDFERGSNEQLKAKQHWDQSKQELFLSATDVMRLVNENDSPQSQIASPTNPATVDTATLLRRPTRLWTKEIYCGMTRLGLAEEKKLPGDKVASTGSKISFFDRKTDLTISGRDLPRSSEAESRAFSDVRMNKKEPS